MIAEKNTIFSTHSNHVPFDTMHTVDSYEASKFLEAAYPYSESYRG
jgi:hypothetical protein